MIRISYEGVSRYELRGQSGTRSTVEAFHGDVFTHEVRVTDAGHIAHEIAFVTDSSFSIECEDFVVADEPLSGAIGEPNGPANGCQPIRAETPSTSPARGSRH